MKKLITLIFFLTVIKIQLIAQNGNIIFDDAILHEIRFDKIDTNTFFNYGNQGKYSRTKISIDGKIIDSIGVTTKGNTSIGHPNLKLPLKIKMNEFVKGKKYDGISKFYLHNNYQDPSLLREKLTYDICKQMGLHSLRTAFSKVYIDNVYWGVYLLVEAKDELYKRDFKNDKSEVFETFEFASLCEFDQDPMAWVVDNGNPKPNWPRLKQLTDKLKNTPLNNYPDTIPKYINFDHFLQYQAVNVYLLNFDSYLQFNGNQLYLYDSIIEKRFQIIPWDFNASFGLWNTNNFDPNTLGIIPSSIASKCPFDVINTIPKFKNTYLSALCLLKNNYCDTITLLPKIDYFYNQIKQAAYSDHRKMPSNAQFDLANKYGYQQFLSDNVPGLKTFAKERWVKVHKDLQSLSFSCNSAGIESLGIEANFLQFFPNPASETITIKNLSHGTIEIINTNGQLMKKIVINENNTPINISEFSKGLYFILIKNGGEILSGKFIKD